MIVITGATGQLGRLVIAELLKTTEPNQIIAAVRSPDTARDLAEKGILVRQADYSLPATLDVAFQGAKKILLISSNEMGQRVVQHQNVIGAASRAGVSLLAYTSLIHADSSSLLLASEHVATEEAIRESGSPHSFLRNGWYLENHTANLSSAVAQGVQIGSVGTGRISAASRADYAAAAAAVLTLDQPNAIYELAGDEAFTLSELMEEVSRVSGKTVSYKNLSEIEFKAALLGFGLPETFASILADSEARAAEGALFDDGKALSKLIGRPTQTMAAAVRAGLGA